MSNKKTTVLAKIDSVSVYELSENSENKELFWLKNMTIIMFKKREMKDDLLKRIYI